MNNVFKLRNVIDSLFDNFFTKILLKNTFLEGMWVYGFWFSALSGFILFSIIRGIIESLIWRKKLKPTVKNW